MPGVRWHRPFALLERITQASSNEGDVVLDPFCGCGTTIAAAKKLNREWIGIDVTHLAVGLMRLRLKDSLGMLPVGTKSVPSAVAGGVLSAEAKAPPATAGGTDTAAAVPTYLKGGELMTVNILLSRRDMLTSL